MTIRRATRSDLGRLTDIYNHYVMTSHATFDVEPFSEQGREAWFEQFDGARYQCWLAGDGERISGYACSTPFKEKAAYQTSVEVSVYVDQQETGRGRGRELYGKLLENLRSQDLHRAYAGIAQPNDSSMRLHEDFGFRKVSHLTEVGRKFDRYWDVVWLELKL